MKNIIEINIEEGRWRDAKLDINKILSQALDESIKYNNFEQQSDNYMVSVSLSNDVNISAINQQFRSKNKPTNVLSFPSDGEIIHENGVDYDFLGDIIFSYETIIKEAGEQDKTLDNHFFHLSIHSILHLLGYDHINDAEAEEMENIEIKILSKHNIANPYL